MWAICYSGCSVMVAPTVAHQYGHDAVFCLSGRVSLRQLLHLTLSVDAAMVPEHKAHGPQNDVVR